MNYLRDSWLEWQRFCQKQEKILEQKLQSVFTGDVSYVQVTRFEPPILAKTAFQLAFQDDVFYLRDVRFDSLRIVPEEVRYEVHDEVYSRDPGLIHLRNRWITKASRRTCGRQPFGLADA